MVEQELVLAEVRGSGKGAARSCRRQGKVPAIIYGKGIEPVSVALDAEAVRRLLAGSRGHIHHLKVKDHTFEGDVMVQEVEREPMTGKLLHLDLHKVSLTDKVRSEVPLVFEGEESLEKHGFILQRQLREVTVECLPTAIPEAVSVNVAGLRPGVPVLAGQLELPTGVRLVTPADEVVAVAVTPKTVEETETETAETSVPAETKPEQA